MSETAPEATAETPAQEQSSTTAEETNETPTLEDLQAKIEELTRESRKWEGRAKDNSAAARAAEKARMDAMSDQERAVEEAKQSARTDYGKRLAKTEFDALAGRRNKDFDTSSALEFVDLGKFLDEDGEPDSAAIKAAVERLVPAAQDGPPSFDGGTRTPPPAAQQGMTGLIRKAAGRA